MKNVLFATTALVLTAGVASAEVTFSGVAEAGVYDDTSNNYRVYSGIDINVAASATTENGLTLSVGTDFGRGETADVADKELDPQTDDLTAPAVSIAMGATTVTLHDQAVDDLYDDTQNGDIGIATSMGDASIALTVDTKAAAGEPQYSYSVGYSMAGVSVTATGTDADDNGDAAMVIGATYTMGNITVGLKSDNKGAAKSINTASVSYVAGPATISVSADDNDDWDASIAYTTGAMTVNFSTDEADAWEADVSYDLGGATAFAATDSNETVIAGVNFAF
jgi:outer membrane protein OmpU